MGRLDGKVAIITGAARGQGEAEARLFVAEGAQVALTDVLDAEGEAVAKELGDAAGYVHLDVTDEQQWRDAVAFTEDRYGPVTVLVNNAGIFHFQALEATEASEFLQVLSVNALGPLLGMKTVAASMARAGGGSIVNISSIAGLEGEPYLACYSSSKWALRGMTKTAALELAAKGIRVNSVHPGGVSTPMLGGFDGDAPYYRRLPIPRLGQPDEVAYAVLFLASDEASYVTGAELAVDGGGTCGTATMWDRD